MRVYQIWEKSSPCLFSCDASTILLYAGHRTADSFDIIPQSFGYGDMIIDRLVSVITGIADGARWACQLLHIEGTLGFCFHYHWAVCDVCKLLDPYHYNDVIMGAIASQITRLTIVYSTVYSGADQRTKLRVTGLCAGNSPVTSEFPAQMASNAKNVFIWWRHHALWPEGRIRLFAYCTLIIIIIMQTKHWTYHMLVSYSVSSVCSFSQSSLVQYICIVCF